MVAPVGGRQEGRYAGKNPTRSRWFPGEMHPVDPALTGDRGAETLSGSRHLVHAIWFRGSSLADNSKVVPLPRI
ncbi:hypothetical protein [Prochlorothrix hollandica]|uniref:hypothetical protein n=1 Tax=Prochlorothrix hollandica TaxID=1223 RepID=UPI00333F9253